MPRYDFDLFTIGAGSGGVASSRRAAGYGARVAICEELRVGGTCVLRGCVPKKLLVYGAQFADAFADAAGFGWTVPPAHFDWPSLIAAKDNEIGRLSQIYINMLNNSGVEIIDGRGIVCDAHTVEVAGQTYTADKILIAVGGHPTVPNIPGIEHVISSNEALDLPHLPRRIVIVGGGYIAVEFAGIFNGFGSEVVEIIRREDLLYGFDDDLRVALAQEMRGRGIEIHTRTQIARIVKAPREGYSLFTTHGQEISADLVMYATGRKPNTRGLGLAEAGVEAQRQRGGRRRRMAARDRAQHLRRRRCDGSDQLDPGRHRRRPRHRRDPLQQQPDQDGPPRRPFGGVQPAADRDRRTDRGGGAPGISARSTSTAPASSR